MLCPGLVAGPARVIRDRVLEQVLQTADMEMGELIADGDDAGEALDQWETEWEHVILDANFGNE